MNLFDEYQFRQRLSSSLKAVSRVLNANRIPEFAHDAPHTYTDKFALAEAMTQISLAAQVNALHAGLGISEESLKSLREMCCVKGKSVTLRFVAEETCQFDKEDVEYVDSNTQRVVEGTFIGKIVSKTVTKVTKYLWKFNAKYELIAFAGGDSNDHPVRLLGRSAQSVIKTTVKEFPRKEVVVRDPVDVPLTWMLQQLDEQLRPIFKINRVDKSCHTPRRNQQVEDAYRYFSLFQAFCVSVRTYFFREIFPNDGDHKFDLSAIDGSKVFIPILPMLVARKKFIEEKESKEASGALVSRFAESAVHLANESANDLLVSSDELSLLSEQNRSLVEKLAELDVVFKDGRSLLTSFEAKFLSCLNHNQYLALSYFDSVNYIEWMLRKQLVSAIGKELTPSDFYNYMIFHSRKLFKPDFAPQPFCFAVRRPDHYPEGVVSIEASQSGDSIMESIQTFVRKSESDTPVQFAINSATNVSFYGSRYLHLWMSHQFTDDNSLQLSLNARARQFSSFIILVGNIGSSTLFLPKFGIVVQNKDDLNIPLMLERIPTAKEFRDAIQSLSPEQQSFAKAYRSMQLESTMFGVVILQIKPQLEKLLNLPYDSLTKEILLTQDLMELFIKYQIPSDLLSYSEEKGNEESQKGKVAFVKNQVQAMKDMLDSSKKKEITERKQEEVYRNTATYGYHEQDEIEGETTYDRMMVSAPIPQPKKSFKLFSAGLSPSAPPPAPMMARGAPGGLAPPAPVYMPCPAPAPAAAASNLSAQSLQDSIASPEAELPSQSERDTIQVFEGVEQDLVEDVTRIPAKIDSLLGNIEDAAVRPTIIKVGPYWKKKSQKALLAAPIEETLESSAQDSEKDKTFDLLDALTRSGSLSFDDAELHIVIGLTHCFDQSLMETVIQKNVNPIEKLEKTSILAASIIQQTSPLDLVKDEHRPRLTFD